VTVRDLDTRGAGETGLGSLVSKFDPVASIESAGGPVPTRNFAEIAIGGKSGGGQSPRFHNRDEELDEVLDGLTKEHGEHFWFVIAPPQLGKSWFLQRISDRMSARWSSWVVRRVDLRAMPAEITGDADALVQAMFGQADRSATGPADPRELAINILSYGKSHLCTLDSAELLDDKTIGALRQRVGEINQHVEDAKNPNVHLALIVASRRDPHWIGITPRPRLRRLPLSEFKVDVIFKALRELAVSMGHKFGDDQLHPYADLVHRASEGLPALLVGYLTWIRDAQWVELQRLETQASFDQLARPYIENDLLSASSLVGWGRTVTSERRAALEQALKALVPYRLFTQSHLSHHAMNGDLHQALRAQDWSVAQLWIAVSGTDLLYRPQGEPWHEINAPIRRLLFRHWYPSDELRARAHRNARQFVQSFFGGELGPHQPVILVECLWHEAEACRVLASNEMEEDLIRLARRLSAGLVSYSAFRQEDLRVWAVERMRGDQELANAVDGAAGLFDRLIDAVKRPV